MEAFTEFFKTLAQAPLPTLLILGGLAFLLLSVVSRVGALLVVTPTKQAQAVILGVLLLGGGVALHWIEDRAPPDDIDRVPPREVREPDVEPREVPALTRHYVTGHAWVFMHGEGEVISEHVELLPSGAIVGIDHPNESRWDLDDDGVLVFFHAEGEPSTRFDHVAWEDGRAVLEGRLRLAPPGEHVVHVLVAKD